MGPASLPLLLVFSLLFHHLFCWNRDHPYRPCVQAAFPSQQPFHLLNPSFHPPSSHLPPIPLSPSPNPCLPIPSHHPSSCLLGLAARGRERERAPVGPHLLILSAPSPEQVGTDFPYKRQEAEAAEVSCSHTPFPLPSAGCAELCLRSLFLQVREGT